MHQITKNEADKKISVEKKASIDRKVIKADPKITKISSGI
jgi:hypothetical protein